MITRAFPRELEFVYAHEKSAVTNGIDLVELRKHFIQKLALLQTPPGDVNVLNHGMENFGSMLCDAGFPRYFVDPEALANDLLLDSTTHAKDVIEEAAQHAAQNMAEAVKAAAQRSEEQLAKHASDLKRSNEQIENLQNEITQRAKIRRQMSKEDVEATVAEAVVEPTNVARALEPVALFEAIDYSANGIATQNVAQAVTAANPTDSDEDDAPLVPAPLTLAAGASPSSPEPGPGQWKVLKGTFEIEDGQLHWMDSEEVTYTSLLCCLRFVCFLAQFAQ